MVFGRRIEGPFGQYSISDESVGSLIRVLRLHRIGSGIYNLWLSSGLLRVKLTVEGGPVEGDLVRRVARILVPIEGDLLFQSEFWWLIVFFDISYWISLNDNSGLLLKNRMLRGWIPKTNTFLRASLEISRVMMLTLVGNGSTKTGSRIMESSISRLTVIHSMYLNRVPLLHIYIIIGFRL